MVNEAVANKKESILALWLQGTPAEIPGGVREWDSGGKEPSRWSRKTPEWNAFHHWRGPCWLTAESNGVKLYTRPGKTMDRPAPFIPYQEVDGIHYFFMKDGKLVWDFEGRPNGQQMQATFEWITKKYLEGVEIVKPIPLPDD